jgi:hypothetical protein
MVFRILASAAVMAVGLACASAANASTLLVSGQCVSVTDSHGCLFQGVINDQYFDALDLGAHPNSYLNAVNAYNAYVALNPSAGSPIDVSPIGESAGDPAAGDANILTDPIVGLDNVTVIGEIDFTPETKTTLKLRQGTWELDPGQPEVAFLAVDGGGYFDLYELTNPGTSGTWDTFDLPGATPGQNPQLYRLVLFADPPAVPEPATWAMLVLGFGMMGGAMRATRRRAVVASA